MPNCHDEDHSLLQAATAPVAGHTLPRTDCTEHHYSIREHVLGSVVQCITGTGRSGQSLSAKMAQ